MKGHQVFLAFLLVNLANSYDFESAKERKCFDVKETAYVDLEWLMSVKKWYYIAMSKMDFYGFAEDLLKVDPKEVSDDKLYYESCINWSFKDTTVTVHGFGGKQTEYEVKPLDERFSKFAYSAKGGSGAAYTTLTDNKTFVFYTNCYNELDQMTWAVGSPYKSLPKKTIKLIHEHAKSQGFKEEFFTGMRYDTCDNDERMSHFKDEL